jgi:thiosulfate/3-mercaptopyruvate sulfurtransferase
MAEQQDEASYPRADLLASARWLQAHLGDPTVKVLDARDQAAYAAGHIPGALPMPQAFKAQGSQEPIGAEAFAAPAGALGIRPGDTVVCYAADGPVAAHIWWAFWRFGHEDVRFLNGGLRAWTAAGYPLTTDAPAVQATTYQLGSPREEAACSLDHAVAALGRPDIQFWDTRTAGEYAGTEGRFGLPSRPGHMPGAIRLAWDELIERDTRLFKPAAEMRRFLAAAGFRPEADMLTY